ncbi:MAG TPA: ATP-binding protein [Desulfuromonadaceae bacterium]
METSENYSPEISLLYVEDEPDAREILGTALAVRYPAVRLLVAENGGVGLELFRSHRSAIVITDITMPVMDGISMAAGIRSLAPETIIIALTAFSDTHYLIRAIEIGINQYLLKPIGHDRLFSVIDTAIAQIMSARRLRTQNEHIRTLSIAVEQNPCAVIITDARGTIEYVNPSFTRLTGFPPGEALGHTPRILQSGATPREVYEELWHTIMSGNVWRGQLQNRKRNGDAYWESASISPVFDGSGAITHFVAVKEDVTGWKRLTDELRGARDELEQRVRERTAELSGTISALQEEVARRLQGEDTLRGLTRLFATLYEANQAIVRSSGQAELFRDICRIVIEHGGFRMAWVGQVDGESGLVHPVAASGAGTEYLDNLRISSRNEPDGCGPTGTAIREGRAVVCNDFLNDPGTARWHDKADACGFRSSAAFALKRFGQPFGAITVYAGEPRYFDQHFIDLFTQLAADISLALENMERERRRQEADLALERSREELKEAQRLAGVGSWQYDLGSGAITWSEEMYRIHGFDPGQPIPSYPEHDRLFAPESIARLNATVEQTLRTGEPYQLDLELLRPDGAIRWITARGEVIRDSGGSAVMLRGTSQDITEQRRLEGELIEAKRLEAIGQLAGGMAHEVRNPLNAILSISEALFKEKGVGDNPEFEPYIRHIRTQVNRLAHLMNDLLELGKPIPPASLHPVPLREVCADAVKLLELSGVARGHRITLGGEEPSGPPYVVADAIKLQQVVSNLLENAIQHSPPGGEVALRLVLPEHQAAPGSMAVIRICDRGSGIPADRINRVFEPFYSTRTGGTGLGLALVRHYIEHMGGQVSIRNNDPPPGCTAEVRIPLAGGGKG